MRSTRPTTSKRTDNAKVSPNGQGLEAIAATLPAPHVIAGVPIHPVRLDEVLAWVERAVRTGRAVTAMYANAYAILLAQRERAFRESLQQAELVFCDGNGVRLAGWMLGLPLPERFTPPDWIEQLAALCERHNFRLFLLGAEPGVAEAAARVLQHRFPSLCVATHHGYFDPDGPENADILRQISEFAPDVLLLGMGMPRQEQWAIANRHKHEVPVVMAVGALFDYMAGHRTRGPRWLTDHGFEWLCRLVYEPRRLWRRYLLGNPAFLWLVLREWWRKR